LNGVDNLPTEFRLYYNDEKELYRNKSKEEKIEIQKK